MTRLDRTLRLVVAGMVWCALGGTPAAARAQGLDVPALLQRLVPDTKFEDREKAKQILRDALKSNTLTAAQIALIREAAAGRGPGQLATLEGTQRVAELFREYVTQQPTVRMFRESVQPTITGTTVAGGVQYRALGSRGQYRGIIQQSQEDFDVLARLTQQAVYEMGIGDTDAAKERLDSLKTWATNLSDERIGGLGFRGGRAGLLAAIKEAQDRIPQARMEILQIAGPPAPQARLFVPLEMPGTVNQGGTFAMTVPQVVAPGVVDVYFVSTDVFLPSVPPPGLEFVGYSAVVLPYDAVEVGGRLAITFQYGPGLLFGNPVRDPARLSLVRIADGTVQPLDEGFFNDQGTFTIGASYLVPSRSSGLDQFGLFAIVQTVPEPAAWLLLAPGLAALAVLLRAQRLQRRHP